MNEEKGEDMAVPAVKEDDKRSPSEKFRDKLQAQRDAIAKQLPKGIDADRFIRTAITTINLNPKLLICTPVSLYSAIMQAAKDGLLPDGKEAVIQPYRVNVAQRGERDRFEDQAQYMPMVRGLIQVMYRTGDVSMVDGVAVYERDVFEYERGDCPRIIHKPYMGSDDAGQVIAAYCVIKLTNGEVKREVMGRRDIEKVRQASRAKDGPGWRNWYDQFAIKAVIKRASKQLPTDSEALERVIEHDNQAMGFEFGDKPAVEQQQVPRIAATPANPTRLAGIMGARQKEPEPVEFDDNYYQEADRHGQ